MSLPNGLEMLLLLPFVAQAGVMALDEFYFHRERGLPSWERIGHPLDTLTVLFCCGFVFTVTASRPALLVFAGLAVFSLIFTAKDEPIHRRLCGRGEHWVHYLLFVLHPLVLGAVAMMWWLKTPFLAAALWSQFVLTALFMVYQIAYWNVFNAGRGFGRGESALTDQ